MRYIICTLIALVVLIYAFPWLGGVVPPHYNPFSRLQVSDPPNFITKYKLRRLDNNPQACFSSLEKAQEAGAISFVSAGNVGVTCPLSAPVRVLLAVSPRGGNWQGRANITWL